MPDSSGASFGERLSARWLFHLDGELVEWEWPLTLDPRLLGSVREIKRSRSRQSHTPRWAYSTTMGRHLRLESSLEHDLMRDLDRRSDVAVLVSQPARLEWPGPCKRLEQHIPDLLSVDTSNVMTIWDVRPAEKQDEEFLADSERTRQACAAVGWRYEVFSGMASVRRINLMWLDGFRRPMPWYEPGCAAIREALPMGGTIAQVQHLDGRAGHVLSAMWHGVWSGQLVADPDARFSGETELQFAAETVVTP